MQAQTRSTHQLLKLSEGLPTCASQRKVVLRSSTSIPRRGRVVAAALPDMLAGLKKALGGQSSAAGSAGPAAAPSAEAPAAPLTSVFFADNAPSWEELAALVAARSAELGVEAPDLEIGPPNAQALLRTFGQPGEPRVTLYRDHATWCPYCEKVVLQLEEKRIPYRLEKINMRCYGDKPRDFMAKVPSGLLPVLEVDGRVVTESATIQTLLESMFPETPLLPAEGTAERARAGGLMRLERRLFSDWLQWLCNGWGHEGNRAAFIATLEVVEKELGAAGGPYFLGPELSLVDIVFAPFLERIAASLAYYKGFFVRGQGRFPNLERWFISMEGRPAFAGFKSDYYTHAHDLPPQLGGCVSSPEGVAVAAQIDGGAWQLPLPRLTAASLPEAHAPGDDPPRDALRAAARLVVNHENVTKFSCRAVGQRGPRPVSSPLCDPTAIPALEHAPAVDAALRHVAHALLVGVEAKAASPHAVATGASGVCAAPVAPSLAYLRDRVCVPRDLPFPAALQLRAHLNWFRAELGALSVGSKH